jgi:hypothetical protein
LVSALLVLLASLLRESVCVAEQLCLIHRVYVGLGEAAVARVDEKERVGLKRFEIDGSVADEKTRRKTASSSR